MAYQAIAELLVIQDQVYQGFLVLAATLVLVVFQDLVAIAESQDIQEKVAIAAFQDIQVQALADIAGLA